MTTMRTNKRPTEAELSGADHAALQLALDLTLADDPPDPGRVEQVMDFLRERSWEEVTTFCSYHQQMERLNLHPAQSPPCWIIDLDTADAILARGPRAAVDGSAADISNCKAARLLKRMLRLGVSPYHPNPLEAIKAARAQQRSGRTRWARL
jgi:hypothetical protein